MKKKKIVPEEFISAILLFIMASIAFVNVLSRWFFHLSFAFTEEIAIHFFVWMTTLGIAIAFERGAHLGMTTIYEKLPKVPRKIAAVISAFMAILLFLIVDYYALREIYMDITIFHMESEALRIPQWIYTIGIPIFSLFIFKNIIKGIFKEFQRIEGEIK
ncbi:MAG: TRAP transporter small permease [Atribacterota bacterium]|nr:TRAP transporter small permease [Atribacterota bacterium]MDD4895177.1 TRAP transporter small permease [Atribacterota bacterium]MDD5636940.1 TRAP transporter small permease [Atribacterota bacterium]